MSTSSIARVNSFERYIEAVREVWGDGADAALPDKVKAIMREMLTTIDPDEPWLAEMIREGKIAKELYHDPDHGRGLPVRPWGYFIRSSPSRGPR